MRVSYEGEVTVVPGCEMFHQSLWSELEQIQYLLQSVWLSRTCIALHYSPKTNPGQEMARTSYVSYSASSVT